MSPLSTGFAPFRQYRTWYRVTGELGRGVPLIVLHGGPGCTHNYVLSLADLADGTRAVVHYDQLGCGGSTRLPDADPGFWTVELFLAELDNLLEHLGIAGSYDVLGQSWGGMLAAEHAVRRPAGLRKLVIADSPASMHDWSVAAGKLRAELPAEVREALDRHEATGDYANPEYKAASDVFYARHVCRILPNPPEVRRTLEAMEEDPTVYNAMNGPNEFHVIGSLRDWTVVDRLPAIEVPTLVLNGRYDEATDDCVRPYVDQIAGARHVRFENSSHMPHVEERATYLATVRAFLEEA
ncbi:proline iminopeptidase-family hydrolase [Amycolatopsis acidiphila]|uniref:Proline iminopeptidase n=1 Tax=Amycolatopsis acidiphila TaxID=715473 RepID=A0A558AHA8_9PSEU|nr:proline iminopeptidase-family hydrolase [Amycolatopsis acidiphila]TVT23653.1 alpha/beta fold hydrolase [Amycolatopsis acidiphila]UIJ58645.1 proline iminopeptidase-family hydrolase [Amycolatopsis acidiphila]GHG76272.1 amino acid amidase [Amycolatopsis acidiphila]